MPLFYPFRSLRVDSWSSEGPTIKVSGWMRNQDIHRISSRSISLRIQPRDDLNSETSGVTATLTKSSRLIVALRLTRAKSKVESVFNTSHAPDVQPSYINAQGFLEAAIQIDNCLLVKGWSVNVENQLRIGGKVVPLTPGQDELICVKRPDINSIFGTATNELHGFDVLIEFDHHFNFMTSQVQLVRNGKVFQSIDIQKGPTEKLQIASQSLGNPNDHDSAEEYFRKITSKILRRFQFIPLQDDDQFSVVNFQSGSSHQDPEISIVIPFYGHSEFMRLHFATLGDLEEKERQKIEIIIVNDDPSQDLYHLTELNSRLFSVRAKLVTSRENFGFAGAVWGGACASIGEVLIVQNSDCFVENVQAYKHLAARIKNERNIGSIAPLLVREDGAIDHLGMEKISVRGRSASFFKHIGAGFPQLDSQTETSVECRYMTGAFLAMRRELFVNDLGGFPTFSFLGDFEDAALSELIHALGYKQVVDRSFKAVHMTRTSFERLDLTFRERLSWYNATQFQSSQENRAAYEISADANSHKEIK